MNKKQLIVIFVAGMLIILSILLPVGVITDYIDAFPTFKDYRFKQIVIIVIIGGLLSYILRDKKKN